MCTKKEELRDTILTGMQPFLNAPLMEILNQVVVQALFGIEVTESETLPEDDRYILLSFENFSLPLVGRYEENEKGGAFYLGDCDEEDTCISNDLYVNAWMYLPERYKGDSNA